MSKSLKTVQTVCKVCMVLAEIAFVLFVVIVALMLAAAIFTGTGNFDALVFWTMRSCIRAQRRSMWWLYASQ